MALEVRRITKRFGENLAIENIDFRVEPGQVFGLLGLNGAGKSTTIRIILDIMRPDDGEVLWAGKPAREARHRFGYLPEERGLYPQMKVGDQLAWYARMNGMEKSAARREADVWLERFDIQSYKTRPVSDLSKGNQQKVQFIMAVLHKPDVLILDEPFSGLDPVNTTLFKDVFREIAVAGTTILFSSHRLDHVEELSDAVGMIHNSRMVVNGNVDALLSAEPPRYLRMGGDLEAIEARLPRDCPVTVGRGVMTVPIAYCNPSEILRVLVNEAVHLTHFELVKPTLNDLFLEKVGRGA